MRHSRRLRRGAALLAVALLAAACGGDDDESAPDPDTPAPATGESPYSVDLTADCPDPFIVQKDWLAQAEHAAFYQLIGPGGEMADGRYSGPLGDTGIDLVILDGGPGMGEGQHPIQALTAGNLRTGEVAHMAMVSTDDLITYSAEHPAVAVVAPLDRPPHMLFWDPETYPEGFESVDDLVEFAGTGNKAYVRSIDYSFGRYLVDEGVPADAFVEGYEGDAENFVANGGNWINQGYASNELWQFENGRGWERPLDYVYVADLGYDFYPATAAVADERLGELDACLTRLVPLVQQAQVDYVEDPGPVNELLAEYNEAGHGAPFWQTPVELNDAATEVMVADGLIGNGDDDTLGNFDIERVEGTIENLEGNLDDRALPEVTPDDVVTNAYIDETIGLPADAAPGGGGG